MKANLYKPLPPIKSFEPLKPFDTQNSDFIKPLDTQNPDFFKPVDTPNSDFIKPFEPIKFFESNENGVKPFEPLKSFEPPRSFEIAKQITNSSSFLKSESEKTTNSCEPPKENVSTTLDNSDPLKNFKTSESSYSKTVEQDADGNKIISDISETKESSSSISKNSKTNDMFQPPHDQLSTFQSIHSNDCITTSKNWSMQKSEIKEEKIKNTLKEIISEIDTFAAKDKELTDTMNIKHEQVSQNGKEYQYTFDDYMQGLAPISNVSKIC